MKIVINTCFGGFGLSQKAYKRLIELGMPCVAYEPGKSDSNDDKIIFKGGLTSNDKEYWDTWMRYEDRNNPLLVQVVEELGEEADGTCASLSIVDIPDDVDWEISEYDGREHVAEKHRTWWKNIGLGDDGAVV